MERNLKMVRGKDETVVWDQTDISQGMRTNGGIKHRR